MTQLAPSSPGASSLARGIARQHRHGRATKKPVPVTFIGDSVAASISYTPSAQSVLSRGLNVRLDLRVCRRLATSGCPYQGSTPPNALQAVQSLGRLLARCSWSMSATTSRLPGTAGHRSDHARSPRTRGKGVVWVTLREERDIYVQTNIAIRTAAKRWPELQVADWNAYSGGKAVVQL